MQTLMSDLIERE